MGRLEARVSVLDSIIFLSCALVSFFSIFCAPRVSIVLVSLSTNPFYIVSIFFMATRKESIASMA